LVSKKLLSTACLHLLNFFPTWIGHRQSAIMKERYLGVLDFVFAATHHGCLATRNKAHSWKKVVSLSPKHEKGIFYVFLPVGRLHWYHPHKTTVKVVIIQPILPFLQRILLFCLKVQGILSEGGLLKLVGGRNHWWWL
jgi:hypothetical protein